MFWKTQRGNIALVLFMLAVAYGLLALVLAAWFSTIYPDGWTDPSGAYVYHARNGSDASTLGAWYWPHFQVVTLFILGALAASMALLYRNFRRLMPCVDCGELLHPPAKDTIALCYTDHEVRADLALQFKAWEVADRESQHNCPTCGEPMDKDLVRVSDGYLIVDFCDLCHGLYLTAQELMLIEAFARLTGHTNGAPQATLPIAATVGVIASTSAH
jgi:hypothetical protein